MVELAVTVLNSCQSRTLMNQDTFEIEHELNSQVPRRIRSRWSLKENIAGMGCLALFFLPFAAVGISSFIAVLSGTIKAIINKEADFGLLLGWGFTLFWNFGITCVFGGIWKKWRDSKKLVIYGQPTLATVVEKKTEEAGDSYNYVVLYEFHTAANPENFPILGRDTVSQAHYESVEVGDVLTVLYQEDTPDTCELYRFSSVSAIPDSQSLLRPSLVSHSTATQSLLHPAQSPSITEPAQLVRPGEPPQSE
jgi:hypothetical protein